MKKYLLPALLLVFLFATLGAESLLLLEADRAVVREGEDVTFVLKFWDGVLSPKPEALEGYKSFSMHSTVAIFDSNDYFGQRFTLSWNEPGQKRIGPFRLDLGEQVIVSNVVNVQVISGGSGTSTITPSRTEVSVGEEFLVSLISTDESIHSLKVRSSGLFAAGGKSTGTRKVNFEPTQYTLEQKLTAKKLGSIDVLEDIFESLPEGFSVTFETITIVEERSEKSQ
jgi:hypothetical protein